MYLLIYPIIGMFVFWVIEYPKSSSLDKQPKYGVSLMYYSTVVNLELAGYRIVPAFIWRIKLSPSTTWAVRAPCFSWAIKRSLIIQRILPSMTRQWDPIIKKVSLGRPPGYTPTRVPIWTPIFGLFMSF